MCSIPKYIVLMPTDIYLYFGAHVKLNTTTHFYRCRPNACSHRYICITSQTSWSISRKFQINFFEKYKSGKNREIISLFKKISKLESSIVCKRMFSIF